MDDAAFRKSPNDFFAVVPDSGLIHWQVTTTKNISKSAVLGFSKEKGYTEMTFDTK